MVSDGNEDLHHWTLGLDDIYTVEEYSPQEGYEFGCEQVPKICGFTWTGG